MIGAMIRGGEDPMQSIEEMATTMMADYFLLEASKATPQYGFKKGLQLFGEEGYMAIQHELQQNLIGRKCVNMLEPTAITPTVGKKALGYLMFLKRK